VQVLADHPEQWALLAAHPDLAINAVHELMRYCPIIFAVPRKAAHDVELAGVTIPAGTIVLANTASANRDPSVYVDPDRLDITRDDPPAILTFGGGTHYCLGAHLARVELSEALRIITQRMPNPRRAEPARWKAMTGIIGPISVPLEFDMGIDFSQLRSDVAGRFLGELYARGQAEFGVDVGEMRLHGAG
jgi:cytochrome P450